jgi:hypothetical protein
MCVCVCVFVWNSLVIYSVTGVEADGVVWCIYHHVPNHQGCLSYTLLECSLSACPCPGQLEYASAALLQSRGFQSRNFKDGRKKYVIPTAEIVDEFWTASQAGRRLKVGVDMFEHAQAMLAHPRGVCESCFEF